MTPTITHLSNGRIAADISARGAELQSLRLTGVGEYLWQGDPSHWAERAPVLFPITGRAPQGRVASGGVVAPMAIHGFARTLCFDRIAAGGQSCAFRLCADDQTRAIYPHDFALTLTYALAGAGLRIGAVVENRGTGAMPFAFGLHPGFCWPLPGAQGLAHDLTLDGPQAPRPAALVGGFLAGGQLPSPFSGGRMALEAQAFAADDSLLFPSDVGAGVVFAAANGAEVALNWQGFDHMVLWHPPGAGFLCIEPWQGLPPRPDAPPDIAQRPGVVTLAPGQSARFTLTITLCPPKG